MNVVVKFFYVHNDSRANDRGCEVGSAKGSQKLFLHEYGSEIAWVCKGKVTISPFAVDIPTSS